MLQKVELFFPMGVEAKMLMLWGLSLLIAPHIVSGELPICNWDPLEFKKVQPRHNGVSDAIWVAVECVDKEDICAGVKKDILLPIGLRPDDAAALDGDWKVKSCSGSNEGVTVFEKTLNLERSRTKALEMGFTEELQIPIGSNGQNITRFYKRMDVAGELRKAEQDCLKMGGRLPTFPNFPSLLQVMKHFNLKGDRIPIGLKVYQRSVGSEDFLTLWSNGVKGPGGRYPSRANDLGKDNCLRDGNQYMDDTLTPNYNFAAYSGNLAFITSFYFIIQ